MDINAMLSMLGLSLSLAQDVTLVLVLALVSFIFGIFIGRYRLVTVLINIYISLAILGVVPEGYLRNYLDQIILFLSTLIILTFFGKSLFEIHISGSGSGFIWRVFMMSFLEIGMIMSIVISLLPQKEALKYVSKSAYFFLASANAQFLWLIIPLIFIFVIHKRLNR